MSDLKETLKPAAEATVLAADWMRLGLIWVALLALSVWSWNIDAHHPPDWLIRDIEGAEARILKIENAEISELRQRIMRLEEVLSKRNDERLGREVEDMP